MNFSGTVGRINLIHFTWESVFEYTSFENNKSIIRYNLIFDLKGGLTFFWCQKELGTLSKNKFG